MRRPGRKLIIAFLGSLVVGYGIAWILMVWLKAEFRFFGFGTLTLIALLWAMLLVFVLDRPLNLKTFDWPEPDENKTVAGDNLRHFLIVGLLIAVVGVGLATWMGGADLLPVAASAESAVIDGLLHLHFWVISFLFALVMIFMGYSMVVFRRKPDDPDAAGAFFHGHTTLEVVWTVVPLVIVLYFGYLGARSLNEITAPKPQPVVVEVEAFQWGWSFRYPELDGITSSELTLPRGRQVWLKMTSKDVIHSFWVPEFRVKQDVVPGQTTELRFTPSLEGVYKLRCAEICGLAHSTMLAPVNVLAPDAFEAWATGGAVAAADLSPEEQGAQIAQAQGCQGCHSVDGSTLVGPTWLGLFGKQETLDDGSTVTVDEAYIRRSILEPGAQIVSGYTAVMPPTYGDLLSAEEIDDLIAYLKSLAN